MTCRDGGLPLPAYLKVHILALQWYIQGTAPSPHTNVPPGVPNAAEGSGWSVCLLPRVISIFLVQMATTHCIASVLGSDQTLSQH